MEIIRGCKVELDLNNKQRTLLIQCAGVSRWAYNWGLARRIQEYKETGKSSSFFDQHKQLNALKKTEYPWLYNYSKCIPQSALQDLDEAYQGFFRRIKSNKKPGFPKFRSRKQGVGSFRLTGTIKVKDNEIRLPRIGWLRLKEHNYIPVKDIHIFNVTVSEKAGHWFVSVQYREEIEIGQATGKPIGIDLGIKTMAVTSDNRKFENPKALRKAQRKLKRLQREFARREKGSQNYKKTKAKVAKLHYQIANIRKDALHKATSAIVAITKPDNERPAIVAIEDLGITGMLKNHCLARAIADVGMGEFRRQIEYKTIWNGEKLFIADRFFPSSRLCSSCGYINDKLTLANREWICDCGTKHNRDLNAACNLRDLAIRNTAGLAGINAHRDEVSLVAIPQAASKKWEPSIESQLGF